MTRPFRIAWIGADHSHGFAWRESTRSLGSSAEIVAAVPGFGGATASLEESLAGLPCFDDVESLLDGFDFDGAVVCLPNDQSPRVVSALAKAGKHVLLEKPGAGRAKDVEAMTDVLERSGVAFQSGYIWRYDDCANRIKRMFDHQRFGKIISVEMSFVTSDVRRRGPDHYLFDPVVSGGGFFNWLACHWLDLLFYVTGRSVLGVTARTGVFGETPIRVEDGGVAILDLEGGGIATFIGGYWFPRWAGEAAWSLRGSERWVRWEPNRPGTGGALEIHGPQPQWNAMDDAYAAPVDTDKGYGGSRGAAVLKDWIESARSDGGPRPCRNTPRSLLTVLKLLDTIEQASREGRRIDCRIGP